MSVSVIVLGWLGEIPYGSFFQNRPRFYWRCCPNWVLLSFLLCSAIMAWFIWLVSDYGFATWLKHCTRFINLNFRRKYQDVMGWPWCFIISLAFRRHGLCASVGFTFSTYERYLKSVRGCSRTFGEWTLIYLLFSIYFWKNLNGISNT